MASIGNGTIQINESTYNDAVKKIENSSEEEHGLDIVIDIIIARIKRYELEDADKLEKILTAKKKKINTK